MDQLKAMLPAIKQHSFWGMCIGILAVSAASWWMSTGTLKTQEASRKNEIKTSFDGVEKIRTNDPKHPNDSTNKGMQAVLARFSQDVAEGWRVQYDHQATVLVWPASFDQEFHDAVNKLRPIEAIPVTAGGQIDIKHDLSSDLRVQYRNYILEDLPVLATTIGTKWLANSTAPGGDGASGMSAIPGSSGTPPGFGGDTTGGRPVEVDTSIVVWPQSSQQEILTTHFGFTSKTELPTTLEVLYAQEDLWVLQSIMDIIKSTNGDAETRHDAVIKELHFVRVGRSALGLAGSVSAVGAAAGQGNGMEGMGGAVGAPPTGAAPAVGPPGGGAMGMPPGGGGMGMPPGGGGATGMPPGGGGEMGMAGNGGTAISTDLADGRYVDEQYQALPAARLRASLSSRDPKDALLAVAKRMPVRMRFKLDQRRLHRVLAECANSRLPIEVRQVRINRPAAAASGGSSGSDMSGMAGGAMANSFGPPGTTGSPPGAEGMGSIFGGGSRPQSSVADASVDPNLIDVEVYGVVYIYNPVNKNQLGLTEAPVASVSPGVPAVPTTTPATSVPPATTGAAVVPTVIGS